MIKYSKEAEKYLSSQSRNNAIRLFRAIEQLPFGDVVRLRGSKNPVKHRLRVGDYRVVFYKNHDDFYVQRIDTRGDIYKR